MSIYVYPASKRHFSYSILRSFVLVHNRRAESSMNKVVDIKVNNTNKMVVPYALSILVIIFHHWTGWFFFLAVVVFILILRSRPCVTHSSVPFFHLIRNDKESLKLKPGQVFKRATPAFSALRVIFMKACVDKNKTIKLVISPGSVIQVCNETAFDNVLCGCTLGTVQYSWQYGTGKFLFL